MTRSPPVRTRPRAIAVAPLALLAGCAGEAAVADRDSPPAPVPVRTVVVAEEALERTTTQPATVHPFHRAEVRAKASGYVEEVRADLGDAVEAGAPLAVIAVPELRQRRRTLEARVARREAEQRRAAAGVELAAAEVRAAEALRGQAESEAERSEAAVAAAEAEFDRTDDLVRRQSLENRMLDEARKKRDAERADRTAMAAAITSAEARVAVARAQQAAAEADAAAAEAETAVARAESEEVGVLLGYAVLTAPFAGVVTDRTVEPGDLVREGNEVGTGRPLFVVSRVDRVRVRVPVPEADAAFVNPGDLLTLRFPAFADEEPRTVPVTRTAGSLDPATRTMLVEAEVDNPDGRLLPGMFGQASIALSTTAAARTLPARAVRFGDAGRAYVYALDADRTVRVTPVTVGRDDGTTLEITGGIEPGRRVIGPHLRRFTDGETVAVLGE